MKIEMDGELSYVIPVCINKMGMVTLIGEMSLLMKLYQ